jgi:hypothetical protein
VLKNSSFVSGHRFTARGKTPIKAGFGKGTSFTRAVKSLEMCLRFSAEVCFLRRDEFFRKLFSDAVGSLNSDAPLGAGHRNAVLQQTGERPPKVRHRH